MPTIDCGKFDGMAVEGFGSVSEADIEGAVGPVPFFAGSSHVSVVADPCGGNYLRQRYVPTPNGPNGTEVTEFRVATTSVSGEGHVVWMSQWMFFEPGFSWGSQIHGGKLNGLYGKQGPTGGGSVTGSNGYTSRFSWRNNPGNIELYVYEITGGGGNNFGHRFTSGTTYPIGEWFCLSQRVQMNTGDNSNGSVRAYLNCQEISLQPETGGNQFGLKFYNPGVSYTTDGWFYSTFHGGGGTWAPTTTCYCRFDDIHMYTGNSPSCCMKEAPNAQAVLQAACETCGTTVIPKSDLMCRGLMSCADITTSGNISATVNGSFGLDVTSASGSNSISINDGCDC